mgnify:CR=1 FL=1
MTNAPPVILGGLPRSGSTLLSALLRQNPVVDVTPTGFLLGLVQGMVNQYTASDARKAWLDADEARDRLHSAIAGAVHGYLNRGAIAIDKERGALANFELLERALGEPPRVIVPVRDLRGCVASMEKLWRSNPEFAGHGANHIAQRLDRWLAQDSPPLGAMLAQLGDAWVRGVVGRCLVVRYEDLARQPMQELERVYQFLGYELPAGVHDPNEVADERREHDAIHGPFGDHEIRSAAVHAPPEDWNAVLGEPLARAIVQRNEWYYRAFYPERLPGVEADATERAS